MLASCLAQKKLSKNLQLASAPGNDPSRPIIDVTEYPALQESQVAYSVHPVIEDSSITIYRLLDALIDGGREMDLYYYLVNQVSIVNFSSDLIEISSGSNKEYNSRLENIISNLLGKKTKIIISNVAGVSLKHKLIESFNKSKTWTNLISSFPDCEILDIIHKNGQ